MIDWTIFANFGIAGLILGVFFLMFMAILKQHAGTVKGIVDRLSADANQNNEAWRSTFSEHANRADTRQLETNEVLRDLSKVMNDANHRAREWAHRHSLEN